MIRKLRINRKASTTLTEISHTDKAVPINWLDPRLIQIKSPPLSDELSIIYEARSYRGLPWLRRKLYFGRGPQNGPLAESGSGLIYVAEPIAPLGSDIGIPTREVDRLAREEGRKVLAIIRAKHSLPVSVREFIEAGDPATEIRRKAQDWAADIIVTGSHGRQGLSRIMLGSVAEAVVCRAPCPVLVVRPKVNRRRGSFGRSNNSGAGGDRVCNV